MILIKRDDRVRAIVEEYEKELSGYCLLAGKPVPELPDELMRFLSELRTALARMPIIRARTKDIALKAKLVASDVVDVMKRDLDVPLSPTEAKFKIEGMIQGESSIEHFAERTEASLSKIIEAVRSQISLIKETMRNIDG